MSSSQIKVAWSQSTDDYTPAASIEYHIYRNGQEVALQTGITTYSDSGLQPATSYSYNIKADDYSALSGASGTVSATTAWIITQAQTPIPSPTPTSSPAPRPIQGTAGTAATNLQASNTPVADIVATPPTTPDAFTATANQGSGTISLSWSDSTATSPLHYLLERSLDQVTWKVINATIALTAYSDSSTSFSTHYYYRLTAIDAAGLSSASATADVTSGSFKANAGLGRDISLVTKDGYIHVTIPSAALPKPASCSISDVTNVPLTGSKGQHTIGGPYQITCQLEDASTVQTFQRPVAVSVTLPTALAKQYKNFEYQAYSLDKSTWQTVEAKPAGSMKFELTSSQMALTILAQEKHFPTWIIVVLSLVGVVGGGVVGLAYLGNRIQRKRLEAVAQDYWDKTNGG